MKKMQQPPQHQSQQPGSEKKMQPRPEFIDESKPGSDRLKNKIAIITGGDSGIGRAVAVAFAREGADIVIVYLNEHDDAQETKQHIENANRKCLLIAGDVADETFCQNVVKETIKQFKTIDILINNAAVQYPQESIEKISAQQLEKTFRTNIFAYFYLTKAALPHMQPGSSIINTTSVTAYKGNKKLIDYSATKGAIVTFTRSLASSLVEKNIRVNGVAPGPIWTPLIPASFSAEEVAEFGEQVPMKRVGQPSEIAASYVFLASSDASYMTGQILHPNGGVIVNG